MGFEDHETSETKQIQLRTMHNVDLEVDLYNSDNVTTFGCKNWESFCKIYGFYEGMLLTMDLGNPDSIAEDDLDIWVLVDDMIPILPRSEFIKHSYLVIYIVYFKIVDNLFPLIGYFDYSNNVRMMLDRTYYTPGSECTYKDKEQIIFFYSFLVDYIQYRNIDPQYSQYVPLVHVLNYVNINGDTMVRFFYYYDIRACFALVLLELNYNANYEVLLYVLQQILPSDCVPPVMFQSGQLQVLNILPGEPTNHTCPYRISSKNEGMRIKEWRKITKTRKEVLGSNRVRRARNGVKIICVLHNGPLNLIDLETNAILFYAILS